MQELINIYEIMLKQSENWPKIVETLKIDLTHEKPLLKIVKNWIKNSQKYMKNAVT